eukprot:2431236-Rhodomonas_salina.3
MRCPVLSCAMLLPGGGKSSPESPEHGGDSWDVEVMANSPGMPGTGIAYADDICIRLAWY